MFLCLSLFQARYIKMMYLTLVMLYNVVKMQALWGELSYRLVPRHYSFWSTTNIPRNIFFFFCRLYYVHLAQITIILTPIYTLGYTNVTCLTDQADYPSIRQSMPASYQNKDGTGCSMTTVSCQIMHGCFACAYCMRNNRYKPGTCMH